ncbi:putative outer membrane protein [Escherichia coli]|uniref:Putative outer membrane protein n=1 Tax=Escherichia coli TaxID=562 RepID=A0A377B8E4_ECOLX|nr:putative outer membrane protein [Escherichia coli]
MVYKSVKSRWAIINVCYEVNDIHGHNIGVVGQGSQLFIRTNEVPPSVNVAIDKQQGLSCTITFGKEIDESRNYICQ